MNNKFLLVFAFAILLFPLIDAVDVSPESFLGTFKQNSQIELRQTCDTCTFVNLSSVQFPDGSISNSNEVMTKNGQTYNLSFSATNLIGGYFYTVCGDKDGGFKCEDIAFEINPSGNKFDNLWMNFLLLFGLSIAAFAMIFSFASNKHTVFYYMGAFLLLSIGVYSIIFGFGGYQNLLTEAFAYISLFLGLLFLTRPWFEGTTWQW